MKDEDEFVSDWAWRFALVVALASLLFSILRHLYFL